MSNALAAGSTTYPPTYPPSAINALGGDVDRNLLSEHFPGDYYEKPMDLLLVRTTPEFTEETVPTGLLSSHQLASHLWARLTVHQGRARFTFEEPEIFHIDLEADQHLDIPPLIPHHVEVLPGGSFSISFFRKEPGSQNQ